MTFVTLTSSRFLTVSTYDTLSALMDTVAFGVTQAIDLRCNPIKLVNVTKRYIRFESFCKPPEFSCIAD
jgi:hypothetical protein